MNLAPIPSTGLEGTNQAVQSGTEKKVEKKDKKKKEKKKKKRKTIEFLDKKLNPGTVT